MVVLSKLSHLKRDFRKRVETTNTGKEKKENKNLQGWDLRRDMLVDRRENIIHEYMYIKIDICICIYTWNFRLCEIIARS